MIFGRYAWQQEEEQKRICQYCTVFSGTNIYFRALQGHSGRNLINLSIQKGLTFYQTRSNAIILQGTLPAFCIPKVERLKTGEVLYERRYMSPRPPLKISLRHDHDWTRGKVPLGSTVEQQPDGKVVRHSRGEVQHATFSQITQPIPKPIRDRSGQPEDMQDVFVVKGGSMQKVFTKNSVLQMDQGNLRSRLA